MFCTQYSVLCTLFSLKTDFKFIGKVESQTNIFLNVQFSLILHDFVSKTNRFTYLYAKSLRKKNLEPNS